MSANAEYWSDLLQRARQGDAEAFGRIYHEYLQPRLSSQALKMLKDSQWAEDLVQDVFIYLFEQQRYLNIQTDSLKAFETYIFKTVRHRCFDELKKHNTVRFWIGAETLESLRCAHIADSIIHRIQAVSMEKPLGKVGFLTLMRKTLGECLTETLEAQLLHYSKQQVHETVSLSDEILGVQPANASVAVEHHEAAEQELQQLLQRIQESLGPLNWQLLEKKYHQGKTYRELSKELESPISTLQARCKKSIECIQSDEKLYAYWLRYIERFEKDGL